MKTPYIVYGGNYVGDQTSLLALSKGPNTVGVSLPLHLRTEADPVSETSCYRVILDFRTMNKVQKLINSQVYRSTIHNTQNCDIQTHKAMRCSLHFTIILSHLCPEWF
jgi:hypothetical protein